MTKLKLDLTELSVESFVLDVESLAAGGSVEAHGVSIRRTGGCTCDFSCYFNGPLCCDIISNCSAC